MLRQTNEEEKGLIMSAVALGAIGSFIPASYVADYCGRRASIVFGTTVMILAAIIQITRRSVWLLFVTRILLGIGGALTQAGAPALVAEVAAKRHRSRVTAIYQTAWLGGSILSATVCLGMSNFRSDWAWKFPCVMQAFLPIVQLAGLCVIPESPKWLVATNRKDAARVALTELSTCDTFVDHEIQAIYLSLDEEAVQARAEWKSFFTTRMNLHRLGVCVLVGTMVNWAGNGK